MKRTVILLLLLLAPSPACAAMINPVLGFYALGSVDRANITASELAASNVAGLSIRFSWAGAETKSGVFNWSFVDSQVALAKAAGKQFMLRPMTGVSAPSWLYTEGVKSTTSNKGGKMPIPWDATMLGEWDRFVAALGARYAGNPSLALVHLSGPTSDSAEMHLPSSLANQPNAVSLTNGAWQNSINAYSLAFPSTHIALDASNVFSSKDGLLQSVSSYAKTKLGTARLSIQNNSLQASTSLSFAPVALMSTWHKAGGTTGFQEVGALGKTNLPKGLAIGKTVGVNYYEIYKTDLPLLPHAVAAALPIPEPPGLILGVCALAVVFAYRTLCVLRELPARRARWFKRDTIAEVAQPAFSKLGYVGATLGNGR